MGLSTEQTTAVLDSAAKLVEAAKTNPVPEPAAWLIPLIVTVAGGIITTIFGVWYAKKRRNKK